MLVSASSAFGARAVARCGSLREPPFSAEPGLLNRPYLSDAHAATLQEIEHWMRDAGMSVRRDALATLIGRYEAAEPGAPALVIASHVDSVRDGGAYDGMLGVLLGVACVEALAAEQRRLPFAIEVAGFGDEEGSRFPASMNASRAFVGALDPEALNVADRDGVSIAAALLAFGCGDASASRAPGSVFACIEPHIEQGPALERAGVALGVVSAIAGQVRLRVTVSGVPGHAGTTPMWLRRDALAGAASMVLAVEQIAAAGPSDLVATIGQIAAHPGAPNVIPGQARFSVDVRAGLDATRDAALTDIDTSLRAIASKRYLTIEIEQVQTLPATLMDDALTAHLAHACAKSGSEPLLLVSGAGHDAMILARFAPTAMLFIRCADGLSHHRDESVLPEDGEAALRAMLAFIDLLERDFRREV